MRLAILCQEFDLHARHVDADRAFALAALARDAELHRLAHRIGRERVGAELAREREAQRIGAAARQVLLVEGGAVGGAHHARVGLAAGAVVVAHLDRAGEAAPLRPVERPGALFRRVARRVAEERAVVHLRRPHDLAGIDRGPPDRTCPSPPRRRGRGAAPNIGSWNSERTMPSPCSPECEPLYSRTMANASSAMARIFLTSSSCLRLSTGRTCRRADRGVRVPGAVGAVLGEDLGRAAPCSRRGHRAARRNPR